MYKFVVLGILPGTSYQTSYMFWVYVGLGFFSLLLVPTFIRKALALRTRLRARFAARKITRYIAQQSSQTPVAA